MVVIKLVPIGVLILVLIGILGYFLLSKSPSHPIVSQNASLTTQSPLPSPSVSQTPTPKPTQQPTPKAVEQVSSTGNFSCTLFLGYSQTNNWFAAFNNDISDSSKYEMSWISGGAAHLWKDAGYSGWYQSILFPCSQNSKYPDRLILDITQDSYLDQQSQTAVLYMNGVIKDWIAEARQKYPSVKQFVLQPVVGGPNQSVCKYSNGNNVRASVNHPFINQAISQVLNGSDIVKGNESQVADCSQYLDDTGHLNGEGISFVGRQVANFYK